MAADSISDEDRGHDSLAQVHHTLRDLAKVQRSPREDAILREALGFMNVSKTRMQDAKSFDVRRQAGPSPADLGVHEPIPIDAVCASVVLSKEED